MSVPAASAGSGASRAAEHEVAAHAGGEVEDDVDVGGAHALDDLAVQRRVARPLAGRGSRTWMCATAAPARAASIAASAICSGVTGTRSLRPVVSPAPVTAQVMKASHCMRARV